MTRRFLVLGLLLTWAVAGCRTTGGTVSGVKDDTTGGSSAAPYQYALQQAANELDQYSALAENPDLDLLDVLKHQRSAYKEFQKLRKRHRILIFVKDVEIAEDDRRGNGPGSEQPGEQASVLYERPIEYEFNANLLVTCKKFINEQGFSELNKDFFASIDPSMQSKLFCGSIKIWPKQNLRANRGIGDLKQMHVYVDSEYRPYGLDLFTYVNKEDTEKVTMPIDPQSSLSSGLDHIPYDLPNLYVISRMLNAGKTLPTKPQTVTNAVPNDPYVARQLAKRDVSVCSGSQAWQFRYRDNMGLGQQKITWCEGDAWPSVIENNRFLAVLSFKPN